jgi:nuclear GTP-binding protein
LRAQARGGPDEEGVEMEGETQNVSTFGNDAISGIGAKRLMNVQALGPARIAYIEDDELDNEAPLLIHRNLPTLRTVLDESDVIIEVLDARDPLPFRSMHLEELIASKPGKQILLVLTKIGASFGSSEIVF